MGLKQIFNKNKDNQMGIPQPNKGGSARVMAYNMNWLSRQALAYGIEPSDNQQVISTVLTGLEASNGQCPSVGSDSIRFRCPCVRIREDNVCVCGLFKTIPPRKPTGTTTAQIKRNDE